MRMLVLVALALLTILTSRPTFADEAPVSTYAGWATEVTGDKGYDYGLWYAGASTKIEGIPVNVEWNRFSGDYQQLWLGAGELRILKTNDVEISGTPTVVLSNVNKWFAGGVVNANFPKLNLSITQKSFFSGIGNTSGKHLTFATWSPKGSPVGLQLYGHRLDHWYLGPTVSAGSASLFVGKRIDGSGWSGGINASFKF